MYRSSLAYLQDCDQVYVTHCKAGCLSTWLYSIIQRFTSLEEMEGKRGISEKKIGGSRPVWTARNCCVAHCWLPMFMVSAEKKGSEVTIQIIVSDVRVLLPCHPVNGLAISLNLTFCGHIRIQFTISCWVLSHTKHQVNVLKQSTVGPEETKTIMQHSD